MTTSAAKWKAAERARHKEAGRVSVTHYVYPADRVKLARYVKRLNQRHQYPDVGSKSTRCPVSPARCSSTS